MATGLARTPHDAPAGAGDPHAADGGQRADSAGHGPTAVTASTGPRLVHEPALDGLRGLAVAAVVAFHLDRLRGGFLGVDLFFVLSGFLITSLLLVEHRARGSIDLRAFWVRRARRLLPALLVLLAGVSVLLGTLTATGDRPRFRGDALATLGYVANWHRMGATASYWDMFSQPSPLDHTWSLAIEEQFYVVWPVVALVLLGAWGGWRGRRLGAAALVGGAASLVALGLLWSPVDTNRAYFGTDSRLGPTLLGAALATVTAHRARRTAPPSAAADGAAAIALVGIAGACVVLDGQGPAYYRGGLAIFTAGALAVIAVVTGGPPGRTARVLSWRPLAALGAVSYGVYLWHWPVIVYLTPERLGVGRVVAEILCVVVTLALALASYRLVERPIRRGALRGWRAPVSLAGVGVAVAAVAVVVTAGVARVPGTDGGVESASAAGTPQDSVYPSSLPSGAARILLVGDSGPHYLGPALAAEAEAVGAVAASESVPFCSALDPEGVSRWQDGTVIENRPCHDLRRERWAAAVDRFDPDVVVYYLALVGGLTDVRYEGRWVHECDAAYDRWLLRELRRDADLLGVRGATIVLATTPSPPWVADADASARQAQDCRRDTYAAVAAARPGTQVVDMAAAVAAAQGRHSESMFVDILHLSDVGAREVASWLVPEVVPLADRAQGMRSPA